jgi:hypothetical protein
LWGAFADFLTPPNEGENGGPFDADFPCVFNRLVIAAFPPLRHRRSEMFWRREVAQTQLQGKTVW